MGFFQKSDWESAVNRQLFYTLYAINVIFQAFLTLAFPIGLGVLASWLLVSNAGWPGWIYAPLVIIGVLMGFYSMVRFVMSAMAGIERLEAQQDSDRKKSDSGKNNEKQ